MPRKGFPIPLAPERPEEFAPGLDPELQQLADALTEFKEKMVAPKKTSIPAKKSRKR